MNKWNYALSSAESAPNTAPILLRGGICANIRAAANLGYQGLEVHMREDAALDYEEISQTAAGCGVRVSAIVTGRLNTQGQVNLVDDRPYIIDAAMTGLREYIRMAARLRTDLIIGWIKGRIPDGADANPYHARLARNLTAICQEAAERGVKIFTEVINRYEVNIFTTAKETVDFLEHWEIPNCYVHLDSFHMNIDEPDPVEAIRLCGKRLGYFHVADNTRLYPGSGTLDFKSYFQALGEIAYGGYISVECLPGQDGQTSARKALEHLKACAAA
ncbi:MAG: sugar phosphate isomerase/epimerase [Candidatus Accumulibacter sp.]|jgi:sugar phosphate isomerase/epimerase|nr:sugar phosphate isomerase/epimerase [Accumulibacter sp.]